jgi:predicted RNase H-like HicB family nuclease
MPLYAVGRVLQLKNGVYVARCPEMPDCEARAYSPRSAIAAFTSVINSKIDTMFAAGQTPPLYSYDELRLVFEDYCKHQDPEPERMPGNFDVVITVRAKLPVDSLEIGAEREADGSSRPRAVAVVAETIARHKASLASQTSKVRSSTTSDSEPSDPFSAIWGD